MWGPSSCLSACFSSCSCSSPLLHILSPFFDHIPSWKALLLRALQLDILIMAVEQMLEIEVWGGDNHLRNYNKKLSNETEHKNPLYWAFFMEHFPHWSFHAVIFWIAEPCITLHLWMGQHKSIHVTVCYVEFPASLLQTSWTCSWRHTSSYHPRIMMTILQAVCILNAVHLVADILRVPILWPVYKS